MVQIGRIACGKASIPDDNSGQALKEEDLSQQICKSSNKNYVQSNLLKHGKKRPTWLLKACSKVCYLICPNEDLASDMENIYRATGYKIF